MDMVRTFTHEEPSSFVTLGSQFSCPRRCAKLGLWSDPKSEFYRTLGPKVRIQIHGSLKYAFWIRNINLEYDNFKI